MLTGETRMLGRLVVADVIVISCVCFSSVHRVSRTVLPRPFQCRALSGAGTGALITSVAIHLHPTVTPPNRLHTPAVRHVRLIP